MPLKYKYTGKGEIPAEHTALYVERDGAFYLDAEGVTEKAKADELRNHNIELRKQIEDRDARFAGVDPDEFRRLAEEKRKLEPSRRPPCSISSARVKSCPLDARMQKKRISSKLDNPKTKTVRRIRPGSFLSLVIPPWPQRFPRRLRQQPTTSKNLCH